MGSDKDGNSDTSSDQETSLSSPNKDGFGRSYECNFCKRGFTNAQALGGHMNIHRKDKAKAKQHKSSPKPSKDHHVSSKSFNLVPNGDARYLGSSFGFPSTDHGCYDQFTTPSNPNFQWKLAASPFDNRALRDEHSRVNLNLGIGTSEIEDNNIESRKVGDEDWLENDIDLELRLGHYP